MTDPLRSDEDSGPSLAALAAELFASVNTDDAREYGPSDRASLAASLEGLLAWRPPGRHEIRLSDWEPSGNRPPVTLVEIVNDDMPFLVDSVMGELQDFGAEILLVAHPVVSVSRDRRGKLSGFFSAASAPTGSVRESAMQVHIARIADPDRRAELAARLDSVLIEVRRAVAGWKPMRERVARAVAAYRSDPPPLPKEEVAEAIAFLEWLLDNNFTLLGVREYQFVGGGRNGEMQRREVEGLGILSDPNVRVLRRGGEPVTMTPAIREYLLRQEALIITKANVKSRVHRRTYMDYIGIKEFSGGVLTGELRIVGLFTSTAFTRPARTIPLLRRKVDRVMARAGFDPAGHSGKALANVLESYPREELFQIDVDLLLAFSLAVVSLEERPRVRVLVRRDKFDRYVSILVYVPRDRYDSDVRQRIGEYLAGAFDGHVSAFFPFFPDAVPLTRVHFIIGRSGGPTPSPKAEDLETGVRAIVRTWADTLYHRLSRGDADPVSIELARRYDAAFPASYRDDTTVEEALADIAVFERLTADAPLAAVFHPPRRDRPEAIGLKLYHLGAPISLSERVPLLEHMGFTVIDERSYEIAAAEWRSPIHVHDMALLAANGAPVRLATSQQALTECLMAIWDRRAENDRYNALVLNAGLVWREAAFLRAVSRYLHQAGTPYAQHYIAETLNRHPEIARQVVRLFAARFDPENRDDDIATLALRDIDAALEKVESLDEDRIIRAVVNLVEAMLRTNFYQDGAGELVAFKLDSHKVEGLPEPRPFREIFLHSPRVDGVHLRFGKVARGGLRWSDRPQDFRTEVLGLVKAQQVKNAVIVPVGAKGGFVPKFLPVGGARDAILAEGQAAYRLFIDGLLDLTDNLDGEAVVPPAEVVRRDGDDPYLVVAADKGTATFSDIANGIAVARDFWLGDAFASGGSAGYDHKAMGITARGAWEAVKRHFRELNVDIQTTPFTVAGVGDMSGDVFGNGMLLSPAIKLVAAFDHRDIFIDPAPDPAASLEERKRLFALPRSSWQDYDKKKISAGGGVFSRREKSVKLTPEIKALLGFNRDAATPAELMQAVLKAKVDLLWFGGIGTYIRATAETDAAVGDRSNDAIRIAAGDVRARVIGEGANLGMTQRARVEYGLAGGRCNSDAIDNSAGVNTSDVEVNIKIALGRAVRDGRLDRPGRDKLLVEMTGEVAELVLANNYRQPLAISLAERRGFEDFGFQQRLMHELEGRGLLNRSVELLPDDAALAERQKAGKPLTRAEIGVLLAWVKIALTDDLVASDLPDDSALAGELTGYFPVEMRERFAEDIAAHRLRREIVATRIANELINACGPTALTRIADRTGATSAAIARAYVAVREAFGLAAITHQIDALDNRVAGAAQLGLYRVVQDLALAEGVWFLRNLSFEGGIAAVAEKNCEAVAAVSDWLQAAAPVNLAADIAARAEGYASDGIPAEVAGVLARLPVVAAAPAIRLVADAAGAKLTRAAGVFFAIGEHLRVARIESLARSIVVTDYYDGLALDRALATLDDARRRIAIAALAGSDGEDAAADWLARHAEAVARVVATNAALTEGEAATVSRVTVAANLLADLAR